MVQVKPLATWRRALVVIATTAAIALSSSSAAAQSAYVPLDDVAYVYIDALIARGELGGLTLLERPYTAAAITQALSRRGRPDRHRALRDGVRRAVSKYQHRSRPRSPVRADVSASLWVTGETSGQRELMLGDELDPGAFAGGAVRFLVTAGPVVGFSRPILENRLNTDPDFRGRTDRRIAGRMEDAYVSGQWRFGELFFGRTARNWGPHQQQGLLLSDAPYTYDHIFGRLGAQRLNVSTLLARLENNVLPDGTQEQRYLATHRLSGRWRGIEAAVSEAFLYTGVARGFEPSLANPFNIYALSWRNERAEGNLLGSVELAARTRLGVLAAQLLVDDLQLDRCDEVCAEPSSYGLTFSAEGLPLLLDQRAFLSYTRVSALAYRTPTEAERYSSFEVGLGRAFADYDEWHVGADLLLAAVPLRAYFASRRQGSGDYRLPFPAPEQYAAQPGFLEPPVGRVRRIGVKGGFVAGPFDARGDVGYNSVSASTALQLPRESGLEGRVRLSWHPAWARLRLAP